MEPQLSVLLYSKYSASSKSLINMIQQSGVFYWYGYLILYLSRCRNGISRYISRVRNISTNVILFPTDGNKK